MKFVHKVRSELEAPRHERVFGSGWISGSFALLAGIVGALMVIVLRNPSLTSVPQLSWSTRASCSGSRSTSFSRSASCSRR
jgi:hypothetical protein